MLKEKLLLMAAVALSVLACGTGGLKVEGKGHFDAAPSLYERFKEYWSARASLDAKASFAFEAPYLQLVYNENRYRAFVHWFKNASLKEISVYKVSCEKPFYCCVDMKMKYLLRKDNKEDVREGHDCWVKAGGKWWHVMRNPLVGPVI